MNGSPNEALRNPVEVRRLRELNQTFGLANGEKWSDQKLLIDFLDNMFNESIPAIAKVDKPVSLPLTARGCRDLRTQAPIRNARAKL